MKIQNVAFTGFDARPLKRLVARDIGEGKTFYKTVEETAAAAGQEGIDVLVQAPKKIINKNYEAILEKEEKFPNEGYNFWLQDNVTFTPQNKMLGAYPMKEANDALSKALDVSYTPKPYHIQGGNFFFIRENNKNALLMGRDELKYVPEDEIKSCMGVDRIYKISQPDFHIDLGIRPLNNRKVLVNDPNLTIHELSRAARNAKQYLASHTDRAIEEVLKMLENIKIIFEKGMESSADYGNFEKITRELKAQGFKPVPVPGSIIRPNTGNDLNKDTHYMMNFLNAITHERADKSVVYITNDTTLDQFAGITPVVEDKINFSFKKIFTDRVNRYIEPDDIHFINGNGYIPAHLDSTQGGVHCLFAEGA